MNPDKTNIIRLDQHFAWLKKRIHFSNTGKVVKRLVPKNIKDRRACIRKAYKDGRPRAAIDQSRVSWEGYAMKYNGYRSVKSMAKYERRIADDKERD